jgi:hypothetical protein
VLSIVGDTAHRLNRDIDARAASAAQYLKACLQAQDAIPTRGSRPAGAERHPLALGEGRRQLLATVGGLRFVQGGCG